MNSERAIPSPCDPGECEAFPWLYGICRPRKEFSRQFSTCVKGSQTQFYGGAKAEIVYDNSIVTGLNIIEGTRGKISFIDYQAVGSARKSFAQLYADIRHYQPIYKEIVFAMRGYAGTFLGNAPKSYLLGGMDNWIGNNTNYGGSKNPLVNASDAYNENILFTEFATGLRGFDYATQYGNSVAMANAEFRLPLVRALTNGPIASNFFRNLQLISFFDIGSAWTGAIQLARRTRALFGKSSRGQRAFPLILKSRNT